MSLRARLILTFGLLITALIAAQLLVMRSLARDVGDEVDQVAYALGSDVISVFNTEVETVDVDGDAAGSTRADGQRGARRRHRALIELTNIPEATGTPSQNHVIRRELTVNGERVEGDELTWMTPESDSRVLNAAKAGSGDIEISEMLVSLDDPQDAQFLILKSPAFESRIRIPKGGVTTAVDRVLVKNMLASVALLVIGLLMVGYLAHRISAPLRQLAQAASLVGQGALGTTIAGPVHRGEEGQAIQAFNQMSVELKRLDDESRLLRERQSLSELGDIARGLAHTIRNPLNAIGLSMEQLASMSEDDVKAGAIADTGRRQIRRVDQWIRSFLALARDRSECERPIDVGGLTREVALFSLQDNAERVSLELDLHDVPPVIGVEAELRAVIHAVIVNAIEASPKAGTVKVALTTSDGRISIQIDDQGPGIDDEIKARLFSPHVTTKAHGSGMGLFLANRIVTTKYGGRVIVESHPGMGTRVGIDLPIAGAAQ